MKKKITDNKIIFNENNKIYQRRKNKIFVQIRLEKEKWLIIF